MSNSSDRAFKKSYEGGLSLNPSEDNLLLEKSVLKKKTIHVYI